MRRNASEKSRGWYKYFWCLAASWQYIAVLILHSVYFLACELQQSKMGVYVKVLVALCAWSLVVASTANLKPEEYMRICLRNCAQCKEMFGRYFHGDKCAKNCIATQGIVSPDCNDPRSLSRYLKRTDPDENANPPSDLEDSDYEKNMNALLRPIFWSYFWKPSVSESV